MRWLLLIGGVGLVAFGIVAVKVHELNTEARQRYGRPAALAAERITRELAVQANVEPLWQREWTSDLDLERVDVVVNIPLMPPTVDDQQVRRQIEAIVREEFRGLSLFSIQVVIAGRAR
jgi:hypothetical protein